jgi:hypothetical protein
MGLFYLVFASQARTEGSTIFDTSKIGCVAQSLSEGEAAKLRINPTEVPDLSTNAEN